MGKSSSLHDCYYYLLLTGYYTPINHRHPAKLSSNSVRNLVFLDCSFFPLIQTSWFKNPKLRTCRVTNLPLLCCTPPYCPMGISVNRRKRHPCHSWKDTTAGSFPSKKLLLLNPCNLCNETSQNSTRFHEKRREMNIGQVKLRVIPPKPRSQFSTVANHDQYKSPKPWLDSFPFQETGDLLKK